MNLDLVPLGWLHLVASLLALGVGALVVLRPKGTPVHKRHGRVYALTLLVPGCINWRMCGGGHWWIRAARYSLYPSERP